MWTQKLQQTKLQLPDTPFEEVDFEDVKTAYEMMKQREGIGIAAPQIGIQQRWAFIQETFALNPVIRNRGGTVFNVTEGCLSVDFPCTVERHEFVTVYYTSRYGDRIRENATGLRAQIWQHEVDHLNGKMISDGNIQMS